jgi:hypothetical protein
MSLLDMVARCDHTILSPILILSCRAGHTNEDEELQEQLCLCQP